MDDKRLEFVAMMLAREEIQYLKPETIRKRVREASAAYDIMVEELGAKPHGTKPRYPWDRAPGWAMWAATDKDGRKHWYEDKPERFISYWDYWEDDGRRLMFEGHKEYDCRAWQDSLESRP